jgi:hypothetical protein
LRIKKAPGVTRGLGFVPYSPILTEKGQMLFRAYLRSLETFSSSLPVNFWHRRPVRSGCKESSYGIKEPVVSNLYCLLYLIIEANIGQPLI